MRTRTPSPSNRPRYSRKSAPATCRSGGEYVKTESVSITVRPWQSHPTLQSTEALNHRRVFVRMRDGRQENEFAELQGRNPSSHKHYSPMDRRVRLQPEPDGTLQLSALAPSPATCENRNEIAKSPPPHQEADLLVGLMGIEPTTFCSDPGWIVWVARIGSVWKRWKINVFGSRVSWLALLVPENPRGHRV